MRITQVIGGLGGGGAERVCVNLANAWAGAGRTVTIVTKNLNATAYALDARVMRRAYASRPPRSLDIVLRTLHDTGCTPLFDNAGAISMLRDAILPTEPDVVVAHLDVTNIRVLLALHGTRIPVIACEHGDVTRIAIGRWMQPRARLYPRAAAVIAPHPTQAEYLARRGAHAVAIPNALVAPASTPAGKAASRRRLIALTRLSEEKRPEMLIRAFKLIAAEHPQWDLEIHGDGPLRHRLEQMLDEHDRVRLLGFAADAYDVLAGADLFVSASWVEAFGNSIWEALACGVPVVAMDCGAAVRALLRHGVDGLIVGTNSIGALANALDSLMHDDAARAAMSKRASEVVKRYPIESSLKAWDEVLAHA